MDPVAIKPQIRMGLVVILFAYVLGMQLIGIQRPFAGHYATYQGTVMASIARNMVRENFSDVLMPKTDSILEGERSLHLNQYPFPSLLTAYAVKFIGGAYEFWGRFQAILFNLLSILLVFGIAGRFFGEVTAWLSAVIFALSPFTVVYGQSFMSEPSSLFFFLGSFYLLIDRRGCTLFSVFLSAMSFSIAITGRLHWILFLPLFCVPVLWTGSQNRFRNLLVFCIFALLLPLIWYTHTYFASLYSAHVHTSLFLQMATSQKGAAFWFRPGLYRAVGMIFGKSMLALVLIPFFIVGIFQAMKSREGRLSLWAGIGIGLVLMILSPEKLIRHDFYLYAAFPFVAIVTALGVDWLLQHFPKIAGYLAVGLFLILLAASARFSWGPIFHAPVAEMRMIKAAESVRAKIAPNTPIIVAGSDTGVFVYYVDRPSWTLTPGLNGNKFSPYLLMTAFTGRNKESLDRLEKASQNPIDWLEYLRARRAAYFVAPQPKDFQAFHEFLRYLAANYRNISGDPQEYLFYSLSPSDSMAQKGLPDEKKDSVV